MSKQVKQLQNNGLKLNSNARLNTIADCNVNVSVFLLPLKVMWKLIKSNYLLNTCNRNTEHSWSYHKGCEYRTNKGRKTIHIALIAGGSKQEKTNWNEELLEYVNLLIFWWKLNTLLACLHTNWYIFME